jgi:hypothetical protein
LLGAVWMNIHPSVFVAAIVPVGFGAALWIAGRPARAAAPYFVFAALAMVGMLVNPYGARLPLEFVRVMGVESTFAVDLFQSPHFAAPEIVAPLLLALVLAALLARRRAPEALVMIALVTGTCIARRYVEILVAFELVVVSRMLTRASWAQRAIAPRVWLALAALPIALAALALRGPKDPFRNVPVEAVRAIDEQNLPDNVMNVLHWGGYLDYVWAGRRRIFMDGRTTQFENGVIGDHTILLNAAPGSRELLDMYLVNTVLWERDTPLDFALARDPAWENVFREGFAVVYVRKNPIR